jgi:predicted nucleic acid-binding protein
MPNADLQHEIMNSEIVTHAFVLGELAVGALHPGSDVLKLLRGLPFLTKAGDDEVLVMIGARRLSGSGIGYIDAHLLGSLLISGGTTLWTLDRRFAATAARLGVQLYTGQAEP